MNVDVRIETADLKGAFGTYIKRRLHFALGRFAGKLGRVRVRVEDILGAGDFLDTSCRIQAQLLPAGRVLREEAPTEISILPWILLRNALAAPWSGPWSPLAASLGKPAQPAIRARKLCLECSENAAEEDNHGTSNDCRARVHRGLSQPVHLD